jgi:hypothetical protein
MTQSIQYIPCVEVAVFNPEGSPVKFKLLIYGVEIPDMRGARGESIINQALSRRKLEGYTGTPIRSVSLVRTEPRAYQKMPKERSVLDVPIPVQAPIQPYEHGRIRNRWW